MWVQIFLRSHLCLFEQKQQQITSNDENKENSNGPSDESNSENSQYTEQQQTRAEEKQESEIVSRLLTTNCVNTKTTDPKDEGDNDCSASEPETPSVQEIETVTIGSSTENHELADQGIFSGSRQLQVKRAGPMITEIVVDEGSESCKNNFVIFYMYFEGR